MSKKQFSQSLYLTFGIMIAVLLGLIGYFSYLLVAPRPTTTETITNTQVNDNRNDNANPVNTNAVKTNKNSKNKNLTNTDTDNTNAGLVEPSPATDATNSNENTNTATTIVAAEGEKVITVYFPKADSDCGEVFPVKRAVTPSDDFYGQIILANIAGPSDKETDYTTAVPTGLRLRRVEYATTGSVLYVNEVYDELNACDQQTVSAQLIETANAMFDLPEGTPGTVIVGEPEDDDTDTADETTTEETNETTIEE